MACETSSNASTQSAKATLEIQRKTKKPRTSRREFMSWLGNCICPPPARHRWNLESCLFTWTFSLQEKKGCWIRQNINSALILVFQTIGNTLWSKVILGSFWLRSVVFISCGIKEKQNKKERKINRLQFLILKPQESLFYNQVSRKWKE